MSRLLKSPKLPWFMPSSSRGSGPTLLELLSTRRARPENLAAGSARVRTKSSTRGAIRRTHDQDKDWTMLTDVRDHLRQDVSKEDPRA